jgi:hypothetical protein
MWFIWLMLHSQEVVKAGSSAVVKLVNAGNLNLRKVVLKQFFHLGSLSPRSYTHTIFA